MSRKCFLSDDDGHWFAVDVDRKGFFNLCVDNEDWDALEEEFGTDELNMHVSNYSFENLEEID